MIEVKNLTYRYPNKKDDVIKGVDFHVDSGEIFGFLGPSGAGKSTIQKILIRILKEYKGHVSVGGKELSQLSNDYYEKIGVAFEFPNFYRKFTGLENLAFFQKMYKSNTIAPLELMRLVGLEGDANAPFDSYSKGMKMRLNFCRALLNDPDILFLDEPTSGLDPVNGNRMKELILEQKEKGKTVILTTHNMMAADQLCDRVAFIVDGKIALIDSPKQLKVKNGEKVVKVEYENGASVATEDFALEGLSSNKEFHRILESETVITMHTQEATLEDIFIKTTGRKLT
ncbi:ABC transporter ATP-binding protein [Bacillus sp. HMF5848]|uniref:ABC transporter ATP-binding protein n=1 Tax=Bacillus sp. HMF5848 TaxID=2495421 RepID=UPI000F78E54C|nr:ABC transporter ATP-binding protein [Bacillus sp. HMF5848]RSK26243.1 ABC transporter ATP-binding protein [Bacillus sp. HMF5848]